MNFGEFLSKGSSVPLCLLLLLLTFASPASAQSGPGAQAPAQAGSQSWETQALVREAGALNASDLPALEARANAGDPRAQVLLGLANEMGSAGLAPNAVQALAWFSKAADQGVAWAEVWAGDFYYTGSNGVPRDLYRAMLLYRSAADHGDPRGAFFLGRMYFFGEGVSVDQAEAAQWFRRAAPADPELAFRMATLAAAPCSSSFCVSLRQVLGALMAMTDQYLGEWDDTTREWDTVKDLPGFERCGFTSSDRTENGDVQNYFCDTIPFDDPEAGGKTARMLADEVATALPSDWSRAAETPGARDSYLFTREGFPRVRVSYNMTPGMAPRRVTLLIGR